MKKLLSLIVLLLVALLMVLTCPGKDAHKAEMMKAVNAYIDEEAQRRGIGENKFFWIGKKSMATMIEVIIDTKLELNNYYLFNTTHAQIGDEDKLLSVGLCGHVFTFDKEMLREALEK